MTDTTLGMEEPTTEASEHGDVVVCTTSTTTTSFPARVGQVARLGSRADLEDLVRHLSAQPHLHHVVVSGDDPKGSGAALVAMWRDGVDSDGRIRDSRGVLSNDIDSAVVDALREDVTITDLRGAAHEEVSAAIAGLEVHTTTRATSTIPTTTMQRQVYLSRKTSFPIFTTDVGDGWLQLLNLTLRIGTEKQTPSGETFAEALNAIITIETPILEDAEAAQAPPEFPDFFDFTADDFENRYHNYHSERMARLGGDRQLDALCELLAEPTAIGSGTIVLEPAGLEDGELPPNLISATFNVVEGRLFATFVLRRCDIYTDWPLEATALVRLQQATAERVDMEVGSATFVIHEAVLAATDFGRSQRLLDEFFIRPLPLHVDPSGVFLFGNDASGARGMLLSHDSSEIFWEGTFDNTDDLSWYIVDTMPWLLPQHIRYVGQEASTLMHAIQNQVCYLQG